MTSIRFLEFLLLLLLLHQVHNEETQLLFRAKDTIIYMGYCFEGDYIVVYRCAPEGDQLLGNFSTDNTAITPHADLQGRIHINKLHHLLSLQISNLRHEDTGIYRSECWRHQTLVRQQTQQLFVCDEEVESEEIIVKEEDEGAVLLCNNTSIGSEGTSVRWYHEMFPFEKLTLFLDSASLDPLVKEIKGVVEVRDNGALLLFDESMLKNNQNFYCLVSKGKTCLSFQNMHLPDNSESRDMFASQGDRVVLKCPSEGTNQQWETPMGRINGSIMKMQINVGDKSEDFSLVIPAFSDEHSGDYLCKSSSLEVHYALVLCPKKESQGKDVVEGGSVLLNCDVGKNDSQSVQWHRQEPSGKVELIHDSNDKTGPIPEDLRGRLSENGSSLTISHLGVNDGGEYWCVVLRGSEFLEDDGIYTDDYDDEDTEEYELSENEYWDDTDRCIFKQETILSVIKKSGRGADLEPVTLKPVTGNYETDAKTDPPAASNVTAYAVGAGLVGLLGVGVIVAVIHGVMKRRAKASPKQKEAPVNVDPGCTERLTRNDESCA